jgi:DNA-binding IclR family transcriptional regulator
VNVAGVEGEVGVSQRPLGERPHRLGAGEVLPTAVGARIRADRLALGVAALATLHPEEVIAEITDLDEHWQAPPAWWSEFHSARRRVVTRSGDYAADLVSVAAPVGMRAAIGIVTGDRVHAQRCAPLVAAAASHVRRALAAAQT